MIDPGKKSSLINMQNTVTVSHTVCVGRARKRSQKWANVGVRPLVGGEDDPRKRPFPTRFILPNFRGCRSDRMGVRMEISRRI